MQSVSSKKADDPKSGLDNVAAATTLLSLPDANAAPVARAQTVDYHAIRPTPESETVLFGDAIYNTRGYEVCGVQNQHGKPCRRIGKCPFHDTGKKDAAPSSGNPSGNPPTGSMQSLSVPATPTAAPAPAPKSDNLPSMNAPPTVAAAPRRLPFKTGWSKDEHLRFLSGLQIHGKGAWKEIAQLVTTRSATQVQSHAQKYYMRQKQEKRNKRSIHDISIEDLNDMNNEPPSVRIGGASLPKVPANIVAPTPRGYGYQEPYAVMQMPAVPSFHNVPSFQPSTSFSPSFASAPSFPGYPTYAPNMPWYPTPVFPAPQLSLRADPDDGVEKLTRLPSQDLALSTQGSVLIPQPTPLLPGDPSSSIGLSSLLQHSNKEPSPPKRLATEPSLR